MLYSVKLGRFLHQKYPDVQRGEQPYCVVVEHSATGEPLGCRLTRWELPTEPPTVAEVAAWDEPPARQQSDNPLLLLEELKALVQRAEQIVAKLDLQGNP